MGHVCTLAVMQHTGQDTLTHLLLAPCTYAQVWESRAGIVPDGGGIYTLSGLQDAPELQEEGRYCLLAWAQLPDENWAGEAHDRLVSRVH